MDRKTEDGMKIYKGVSKQNMNTTDKQDSLIDIPTDVYSVIRSAEIKDYFQKNDCMGFFGKEQIILHSYTSIQQKAEMLRRLSHTGSEKDNKLVEEMYRVYSKYIETIYHPAVRTVFILECKEWRLDDCLIDNNNSLVDVFDTVDELVAEIKRIYGGEEKKASAYVTVLQVPQDRKVKVAFKFTMFWIDGKWEIKDLCVNDEELEMQEISEDTIHRFCNSSLYHPLPFENGCRLKLQLPFMERPVYGTLESELDGNGCWYHFLYCEGDRYCLPSFNLTNAEIDLISGYSSLDWIERA